MDLESVGGREDGQETESKGETRLKGDVKIGERIASGGHLEYKHEFLKLQLSLARNFWQGKQLTKNYYEL